MKELLDLFPKDRPPLPSAYHSIYEKEYLINRSSGSFANRIATFLESWMHRRVANASQSNTEVILEIGGGTLNHVKWEGSVRKYDVVEPNPFLIDTAIKDILPGKIYSSLNEIQIRPRYDRIFSIAVLEHLCDLPQQVARSALLMKEGGVFCAGIPSEGSLLWEVAWRCGTGVAFKKRTGLDYEPLMRHEHVNTEDEIIHIVRYFFNTVSVSRFPLTLKHGSLYAYIEASAPNLTRCAKYLQATAVSTQ